MCYYPRILNDAKLRSIFIYPNVSFCILIYLLDSSRCLMLTQFYLSQFFIFCTKMNSRLTTFAFVKIKKAETTKRSCCFLRRNILVERYIPEPHTYKMIAQKLMIAFVIPNNKSYRIVLTSLFCLVSLFTTWSQKTIEVQTLPDFRFFTAADSVLFTTAQLAPSKPILLFYFSTKCSYCQDLTKEITQSIDSLKSIQILMVSGYRRQSIAKYIDMFSLNDFPITVLKDDEKRMHEYFDYSAVPMLRLYDKNRQLIYRQEGKLSVKEILTLFRQHI